MRFYNHAKIIINFYTFIIRKTNCLKFTTNGGFFRMNYMLKLDFRSKIFNFEPDFDLELKLMKSIRLAWIIHIFALLHAVVALSCRFAGVDDELLLTVLTMTLALIICMRKELSIEFTAAIVIVMNILGFFLGTFGARILEYLFLSGYAVNAVATALTTEILGWSVVAMTQVFRQSQKKKEGSDMLSSPYLKWLLLVVVGIFVLRLLIVLLFSNNPYEADSLLKMTGKVLSNSVSLTMLICVNILYVRYILYGKRQFSKTKNTIFFISFMLAATLLETALVSVGLPMEDNKVSGPQLPLLLAVSFMTQITIYCIVYVVNYAITVRHEMQAEREKANMAQYRYLKLKRQVNPHFLFNSLNILDCLICEEKTEKASTYTHKLAGIYRYMIKSEEEELVPLRDELVFVQLYIDLLKVRFPEGFDVMIDVPEDRMARFVPPCSIQLLIENATKHNAVNTENPLTIKVEAEGEFIHVSNNIVPKVTKNPSTGLGQKYIRQLYMDLSGKSIEISSEDNIYRVTLPLL